MNLKKITLSLGLLAAMTFVADAQVKQLKYANMDSWIMREIKESSIIGGKTRVLYEIGKTDTIREALPHNPGDSPWETSSVYARVSGITKGSSTVFPERRGNGYCARMETRLEEVVVLGLINLKVLATGTIFTGILNEPVRDSKDPMQKLVQGIEMKQRIKAIKFDYKAKTGGERIKATGFSRSKLEGKNAAEAVVILQKRWEDADGNIYAKRVGTAWHRFTKTTTDWVNGYEMPILYGDITKRSDYQSYMGLTNKDDNIICGKNTKGEKQPIVETGWADAGETPTHMIIRFSSGYGGAYVGAVGDMFWVDNIVLVE